MNKKISIYGYCEFKTDNVGVYTLNCKFKFNKDLIFNAISALIYKVKDINEFAFRVIDNTILKNTVRKVNIKDNDCISENNYLEDKDIISDVCIIFKESGNNDVIFEEYNGSLIIEIVSENNYFNVKFIYNQDIISDKEAEILAEHFSCTYKFLMKNSYCKAEDINIISEEELNKVIKIFNDNKCKYDDDKCLHEIFDKIAYENGELIAIEFDNHRYTFKELKEESDKIASFLISKEIGIGDFVGLIALRGFEMIASMLGIMKTGAAYVPISPLYPKERIIYILEDCGAKAILTNVLDDSVGFGNILQIKEAINYKHLFNNRINKPDDNIAIIYTSGTTGNPKGVLIRHRTVINYCQYNTRTFNINENDRIVQFAPYTFSTSIYEIFTTLLSKAELMIPKEEVIGNIQLFQKFISSATILLLPPQYCQIIELPENLRILETGASVCTKELSEKISKKTKHVNAYGLTEGGIVTVWNGDSDKNRGTIPIGKPVSNVNVYVLRKNEICGIYMPGELCVSGVSISNGYVNNEELNQKKFVDNPFENSKMLRTGDIVQWDAYGNIEYIGRTDDQVKVRGIRVEIPEVEKLLERSKFIKQAVVIEKKIENDSLLAAYFISKDEQKINRNELVKELNEYMPEYMIPSYIMQVDSFKLTVNGKIDKKSLPDINESIDNYSYEEPKTKEEKIVVEVYKKVLGLDKIGINDNFFLIGGHSLRASKAVNILKNEYNYMLMIEDIFKYPKVKDLAKHISTCKISETDLIQPAKIKEFYPMHFTQRGIYASYMMEPKSTTYNMSSAILISGEFNIEKLNDAYKTLIRKNKIFQTGFVNVDGEVVQKIFNNVTGFVEELQCNSSSEEDINSCFDSFVRPFDLSKPPLSRLAYTKIEKDLYLLMFDIHHIISDGMSMNIIKEQLSSLYNGDVLPESKIDFKDYSVWNEKHDWSKQKKYWKNKLENFSSILELPTDNLRRNKMRYNGNNITINSTEEMYKKIKSICNKNGVTEYMVLLSAYIILLHRWSGQKNITIGTPVSGRTQKDTENIIGMFANTIPSTYFVNPEMQYSTLIENIKETCLNDFENQNIPFYELVEMSGIRSDDSRNPLVDTLFAFQNNEDVELNFNGVNQKVLKNNYLIDIFDVLLNIEVENYKYKFTFEYNTDLFGITTAKMVINEYVNILSKIIENSNMKIIDYLSEDNKINSLINNKADNQSIIGKFKSIVNKYEDKIAIFSHNNISYKELDEITDSLAMYIRENIKEDYEKPIVVVADDSYEYVISIISVIKSGYTCIPVSVYIDEFDLDDLWESINCSSIILNKKDFKKNEILINSADYNNIDIIDINSRSNSKFMCLDNNKALIKIINENGKVLTEIYSNDINKNVNIMSTCIKENDILQVNQKHTSILNLNEIFGTLLCGGSLLYNNDDAIDERATVIISDYKNAKNKISNENISLKKVIITDLYKVDNFKNIETWSALHHLYTKGIYYLESDNCCSDLSDLRIVCDNKFVNRYIAGELCIDYKDVSENSTIIHTGKIALFDLDNKMYIQNYSPEKVGNYLVDKSLYKKIIIKNYLIKDYHLLIHENNIYIFIVANNVNESDIINKLRGTLPQYMMPKKVIILSYLPLDAYGNINEKELLSFIEDNNDIKIPVSYEEKVLFEAMASVLEKDDFSIDDDFFAIGGNSLKAIKLINIIEEKFGKKIELANIFTNSTVELLAKFIQNSKQEGIKKIPLAPKNEYYKASSAQKRMYILNKIDENSIAYNMPGVLKFNEKLDKSKVVQTVYEIMKRHEILRTSFEFKDDELIQIIHEKFEVPIEFLEKSDDVDIDKEFNDFIRPFNMEESPLFRIRVLECINETYLMIDMSHIICDGISYEILKKEFAAIYNNKKLPEMRIQYKDYCDWFNNLDFTNEKEYWKNILEGPLPILDFPLDFPRPSLQKFEGSTIRREINSEIYNKIKNYAIKNSVTEYTVFLSAFMVLIGKYSRQEDIIIGTPVSGRIHQDIEKMMGMFVNTLPMRAFPSENKKFNDFLREVNELCISSFTNQNYPLDKIIEDSNVNHELSRNPLFDIMLVFQNIDEKNLEINKNLNVKKLDLDFKISKMDFTLYITPTKNKAEILLEYSVSLFTKETMEYLLKHFINILDNICLNDDKLISEIDMLDSHEYNTIVQKFNNTTCEFPKETIQELFEASVNKYPNKTAVIYKDESLTYNELNKFANKLGNKLRNFGVKPNDKVVIIADRSIEMIIGIYGILKSGAAYVPVSPSYPKDRIKYIIDDCNSKNILYYDIDISSMDLSDEYRVINLEEYNKWDESEKNLINVSTQENSSYVIYTSGTTGKPKGVTNIQKGTINRINWMDKCYPITTDDVILQKTNYTFDVSVWEILWWGFKGATVDMLVQGGEKDPEVISDEISRNNVTVMHFVPSMFNVFLSYFETHKEEINKIKGLKYIFTSGEALQPTTVNDFFELFNKFNIKLVNLYGPTEASIDVTCFECDKPYNKILIGKPIDNIKLYVLNNTSLCGIGVPGELCIAGIGLATGYINRPELTKEKFIDNLFGEGKLYRTGDLVRWNNEGSIEYLGRIDEQVKIRGMRIEIDEILNVIREVDYVKDVAIIVKEDKLGEKTINAYVISEKKVCFDDLKRQIAKKLPNYMIPSLFMQINEFPITKNGKLDKKSFPDIIVDSEEEYKPPVTEKEIIITDIFKEVLGVEKIGINDNFFKNGGHSLRATKVINYIYKMCNVKLKIQDIYNCPTIKQLSELVENQLTIEYNAIKPAVKKDYYITLSAQKRLYAIYEFDTETLAYNTPICIKMTGKLNYEKLKETFKIFISRHEAFRTEFKKVNGEVVQVIKDNVNIDIEIQSGSEENATKAFDEFIRPFKLDEAPLLRVKIYKIDELKNMLFVDMHHIICDGIGITILSKELSDIYNGKVLPELKVQYKDYCEWDINNDMSKQEEFWKRKMSMVKSLSEIKTDYMRPKIQSFNGNHISYFDNGVLRKRVNKFAEDNNTTEFVILMSAYTLMINKCFGINDILVGNPVANRMHPDITKVIGMFSNTVVFYEKINNEDTLLNYIEKVNNEALEILENQDYPFEKITELSNIKRDASRNHLFDTLFVLQNTDNEILHFDNIKSEIIRNKFSISKFDSLLNVGIENDAYIFNLEYNTDLFKQKTIETCMEVFLEILNSILNNPKLKIAELLTTEIDFSIRSKIEDENFTKLFKSIVSKNKDKYVLIGDENITYLQLDNITDDYAQIINNAIGEGKVVGYTASNYYDYIVYLLSIIKSGNTALPVLLMLDEYEIEELLTDANCSAFILNEQDDFYEVFAEVIDYCNITEIILKDVLVKNILSLELKENNTILMYSNNTGDKNEFYKYSFKDILNMCKRVWNVIDEYDTVLHFNSLNDALSLSELFGVILKGATICVNHNKNLLERVTEESYIKDRISVVITNSTEFFSLYKNNENCFNNIKKLIISDVIYSSKKINDLRTKSNLKIFICGSGYDTCGISYIGHMTEEDIICDNGVIIADGRKAKRNVVGEICIYESKFKDNIYHTGIYGKYINENQIKVLHGNYIVNKKYKVDIKFIKYLLDECNSIKEYVICEFDKIINVFIVSDNKNVILELKNSYPDYVVPEKLYILNEIPRDLHGNPDKYYLEKLKKEKDLEKEVKQTKEDDEICKLIAKALDIEKVTIMDDFFVLGGNSLTAFKVINSIEHKYGVKIPLSFIFGNPTIKSLCNYINENNIDKNLGIAKAKEKEYYALSPAQKRMYILYTIEPNSTAYNVSFAMKINGKPDIEKLNFVLKTLIDRHEIIRTSFVVELGEVKQHINNDVNLKMEISSKVYNTVSEAIEDDFIKAFDLSKAPLLRMRLCILSDNSYAILFDSHHIITDGTSIALLAHEFSDIYNNVILEKPNIQYKDYSEWIQNIDLSKQKKFWIDKYKEGVPTINLITDFSRKVSNNLEGDKVTLSLNNYLVDSIKNLAIKLNTTVNVIYMSAVLVLLSRYSRQEDLVIGSPVSGRNKSEIENIQGMFVNTLAMRFKPKAEITVEQFIKDVNIECLKCYENQDYPFEYLVDDLNISRELSRNALFDVMFVYQNIIADDMLFDGNYAEVFEIDNKEAKFDLSLGVVEKKNKSYLVIEYAKSLFRRSTIEYMIKHLENILKEFVQDVSQKIGEVSEINEEEFNEIILMSGKDYDYNKDISVVEKFYEIVEKYSNKKAIIYNDTSITFSELNKMSNQFARRLIAKGIKEGEPVVVSAEKKISTFIAYLGIIKARGVFVPVISDFSEERIRYIIKDSNASIVIDEYENLNIESSIKVMSEENLKFSDENVKFKYDKNAPVYIIYTSGTTGNPKGVSITNLNLAEFREQLYITMEPRAEECVLQFSKLVFDASVWEYMFTFSFGCTLYIPDEETFINPNKLGKYIRDNNIVYALIPTMYLGYLNPEDLKGLKYVITGGFATNNQLVSKYRNNYGYLNLYGPTEATVSVTQWKCSSEDIIPERIPIGKPLPNVKVYILSGNRICGIGVPGELCVSCDGLSLGYLNNLTLTNKQFIDNPFGKGRIYRTGDLTRMLPDGNIEYLSRIDRQVKIRGFRIELLDIETVLCNIDGVKNATVVVKKHNNEDSIFAYFTADSIIEKSFILESMKRKLPTYMIPSAIMQLEKIPMNTSGKVNENLLPDIEYTVDLYEAPIGKIEEEVAEAFSVVLGNKKISRNENFFTIGGDSLKAMRVASILSEKGYIVSVKDLIALNSIESIANMLSKKSIVNQECIYGTLKAEEEVINSIKLDFINILKEYSDEFINSGFEYSRKLTGIQRISFGAEILHSYSVYRFTGNEVSYDAINYAWEECCKNFENLRAGINIEKGIQLYYKNPSNIKVPYIDLSMYDNKSFNTIKLMLLNILNIFDNKEIYDGKTIMSRAIIIKQSENNYLFMLAISHLIFDQQSQIILENEMNNLIFNNKKIKLKNLYTNYLNMIDDRLKLIDYNSLNKELEIKKFKETIENYYSVISDKEIEALTISRSVDISINEKNLMFIAENVLKIALKEFGCDEIPLLCILGLRNFDNSNYNETIGELIDFVPAILGKDYESIFNQINDRNKYLKKNKIIFSSLWQDNTNDNIIEELKEKINFNELKVPVFNYLGIHPEASIDGLTNHFNNPFLYAVSSDGLKINIGNIPVYKKNLEKIRTEINEFLNNIRENY